MVPKLRKLLTTLCKVFMPQTPEAACQGATIHSHHHLNGGARGPCEVPQEQSAASMCCSGATMCPPPSQRRAQGHKPDCERHLEAVPLLWGVRDSSDRGKSQNSCRPRTTNSRPVKTHLNAGLSPKLSCTHQGSWSHPEG